MKQIAFALLFCWVLWLPVSLAEKKNDFDVKVIINETLNGPAYYLPDGNRWIVQNGPSNNTKRKGEVQTYTNGTENVHLTGRYKLAIVPLKTERGWTSGHVESKWTFTPVDGAITTAQTRLFYGNVDMGQSSGISVAVYLLGDSLQHGGTYPACGEVGLVQLVPGKNLRSFSVHCGTKSGGICNEPYGLFNNTHNTTDDSPQKGEFTAVSFDRRARDWKQQTIYWWNSRHENYHVLSGNDVHDKAAWEALTAKPLYLNFKVAVGGDLSGPPNARTASGVANKIELGNIYVISQTAKKKDKKP